jgi:hypothetical protein
MSRYALPVTIFWVLGCSADPPVSGVVADTTSAGVVYARVGVHPMWTDADHWQLEPIATLGTGQGPSGMEFGGIRALALDSTGRVFVAEASHIHVFDSAGRLSRTIGTRGDGPGEYRWIAGLEVLPGQRLLVVDYITSRYTLLDSLGTVIRTAPRPLSRQFVPWPGRRAEGATVSDYSIQSTEGVRYLVQFSLDSALVLHQRGVSRLPEVPPNLFGPELTLDLNARGALLGLPVSNEFVFLSILGDSLRHVRWLAPLPRSTAAERREAEDAANSRVRMTAAVGGADAGTIPEYKATEHKPSFRRLRSGPEGSVWLELLGEPYRVAVFDGDSRYLGNLLLPDRPRAIARPVVTHDRLIMVTEDSNGNDVAHVFRIVR